MYSTWILYSQLDSVRPHYEGKKNLFSILAVGNQGCITQYKYHLFRKCRQLESIHLKKQYNLKNQRGNQFTNQHEGLG